MSFASTTLHGLTQALGPKGNVQPASSRASDLAPCPGAHRACRGCSFVGLVSLGHEHFAIRDDWSNGWWARRHARGSSVAGARPGRDLFALKKSCSPDNAADWLDRHRRSNRGAPVPRHVRRRNLGVVA